MFFRRGLLRKQLVACGAAQVPSEVVRRLQRALDSAGTDTGGECVPAPHHRQLRVAALRAARWPDLPDRADLRRLPLCSEPHCCNPYHWSRLCKPEGLPPPYCCNMENFKRREDGEKTADARRTDHERVATGSLTTDGEEKPSWEREWCRLAYWELSQRVGRQYRVQPRWVDVFSGSGSSRQGMCLDALSDPRDAPIADQVRKTRAKIGLGVTLSQEEDGVWLYNRSSEPVFVSSPALDAAAARALLVWRVAPGHCLCIFDPAAPVPVGSLPQIGPVDPRSVRISFAKGWGPKYSRRDVTACPCWLEVLLAPPGR